MREVSELIPSVHGVVSEFSPRTGGNIFVTCYKTLFDFSESWKNAFFINPSSFEYEHKVRICSAL